MPRGSGAAAAAAKQQQLLEQAQAHLKPFQGPSDDALEAELAALMGDDSIDIPDAAPVAAAAAPPPVDVPVGDLIDLGPMEDVEDMELSEADLNDPALAAELAALSGGAMSTGPSMAEKLKQVEDRLGEFKAAVGALVKVKNADKAKELMQLGKPLQGWVNDLKGGKDVDISELPEVPNITTFLHPPAPRVKPQPAQPPPQPMQVQHSAQPPQAGASQKPKPDFDLINQLVGNITEDFDEDDFDDEFDDEELMLDDEDMDPSLLAELEGLGAGSGASPPAPQQAPTPQRQQASHPPEQSRPTPAPRHEPEEPAQPSHRIAPQSTRPRPSYRTDSHEQHQTPHERPHASYRVDPQPPRRAEKRPQQDDPRARPAKSASSNLAYVEKLTIEYKIAARNHHRQGQMEMASYCLQVAQQLGQVKKQLAAGHPYDLRNLPPPPVDTATGASDPERDSLYDTTINALKKQMADCDNLIFTYNKLGDLKSKQKIEKTKRKFKQDINVVLGAKVNGDEPPSFVYREFKFPIQKLFPEIRPEQMEVKIVRVINMVAPDGVSERDLDVSARAEIPYPSDDEPQFLETKRHEGKSSFEFNHTHKFTIQRNRGFQRVCKREKVMVSIRQHRAGGMFGLFHGKDEVIGKVAIPLAPFQSNKCEIHDCFPIVDVERARRPIGGKLEVRLRLRNPLQGQDLTHEPVRWLVLQKAEPSAMSKLQASNVAAGVEAMADQVDEAIESHTPKPRPKPKAKPAPRRSPTKKAPTLPEIEDIFSYEVIKEEHRLATIALQPVMQLLTSGQPIPEKLRPTSARWMQAGRKMKKIEAGLTSLDAMKAYFEGLKADLPKRKQYIQQLQASGSPGVERAMSMYKIELNEAQDLQKNLAQMGG